MNSFYFSHDYNAHKDPKCSALINDFGMAGYGLYWILIEIMYEQGGKIKKFPKLMDGLAFQLRIEKEALLKQIQALVKDYELIKEDDEFLWSTRVLRNLEERDQKYLARAEAGRKGGLKSSKYKDESSNDQAMLKQNEALLNTKQPNKRKEKEIKVSMSLEEIKNLEVDPVVKGLLVYIQEKTDQVKLLKKQLTVDEAESLIAIFSKDEIKDVLGQMDNFNGLTRKYTSVYRTSLQWLKNNRKWEKERQSSVKSNSMQGFNGLTAN